MDTGAGGGGLLRKIINFITFVDLPIRRKFVLFSMGVLFWFLTMSVISIATLLDVNVKARSIVGEDMPRDRLAQKITRKLQGAGFDLSEIVRSADSRIVTDRRDRAKARLQDVDTFLTALTHGGQINDIYRESDILLESFSVKSVRGDASGEKYVNDLSPLADVLARRMEEIAALRAGGAAAGDAAMEKKYDEFREALSSAIALSNDFSARTSKLYAINFGKIRTTTSCTTATVVAVLAVATGLLALFTLWISGSILKPVNSIVEQIRALGEGDADLTKRITITSRDEIGTLSKEFNGLMETIQGMATFKKVIEEDESLEDVYSRLGGVFNDNGGMVEYTIFEVSNSQNRMKPVYPLIVSDKDMACSGDILSKCDLCRAKKTGHAVSSLTYPQICKQFRSDLDKAHVCIPMIVGGTTGGVVQLLFDQNGADPGEIDRRIFRAERYIKESLSVIEAKRLMNTLRDSALKDSLTGLYNRRFLQEYTETLVAGVLRRGKHIGLIMCDLDYFKQVNDLYGHSVGDILLKETANIIRKSVRDSDLVIRFGGEEFLVVLFDIQDGEATNVADKIRTNMQEVKFKVSDGILKKTISLGVSEFPKDTQSFWQAIKFADVALYRAKETGRNKAVRFTTEMWKEEQF